LYDWFMRAINDATGGKSTLGAGSTAIGGSGPIGTEGRVVWHSQQIEFAKFKPTYTLLSKRNLLKMVQEKIVSGWDDPRMPTIRGLRRRGYPAAAMRAVCEDVGVTKVESVIDVGRIENAVRDVLNRTAPRAMSVLRPVKVVLENWPAGHVEMLDFVIMPEDSNAVEGGNTKPAQTRKIPFSGTLYIEQEDFMEVAPKKFFRLAIGQEVRLRWAYFIKATSVVKDASGNLTQLNATYAPATKGGDAPAGPNGEPPRKVKGTLHWVSAQHAVDAQVRLFDRLFNVEEPGKDRDWKEDLNPKSLEVVTAKIDPHLTAAKVGDTFQFERLGYFRVDEDTKPGAVVFNRTVTLKDDWAKQVAKA
ncbi:MAG: glutamate--tRNA ligase family protein, partial [Phycisphaerae bacterium]